MRNSVDPEKSPPKILTSSKKNISHDLDYNAGDYILDRQRGNEGRLRSLTPLNRRQDLHAQTNRFKQSGGNRARNIMTFPSNEQITHSNSDNYVLSRKFFNKSTPFVNTFESTNKLSQKSSAVGAQPSMTEEEIRLYHDQIAQLKAEYDALNDKFNMTIERNKRLQMAKELNYEDEVTQNNSNLNQSWENRFPELNYEQLQTDSSIRFNREIALRKQKLDQLANELSHSRDNNSHPKEKEGAHQLKQENISPEFASGLKKEHYGGYTEFNSPQSIVDSFGSPSNKKNNSVFQKSLDQNEIVSPEFNVEIKKANPKQSPNHQLVERIQSLESENDVYKNIVKEKENQILHLKIQNQKLKSTSDQQIKNNQFFTSDFSSQVLNSIQNAQTTLLSKIQEKDQSLARLKTLITSKITDLVSLIKIKDATVKRVTLIAKKEQKKVKNLRLELEKIKKKNLKKGQDFSFNRPQFKEDPPLDDFGKYETDLEKILKKKEQEISQLKSKFSQAKSQNKALKQNLTDARKQFEHMEEQFGKYPILQT